MNGVVRYISTHLEVVSQGVADEYSILQDRRHFLLALAQTQTALEVVRLDAAHEGPEVRHALVGGHVLVVAEAAYRVGGGGGGRNDTHAAQGFLQFK